MKLVGEVNWFGARAVHGRRARAGAIGAGFGSVRVLLEVDRSRVGCRTQHNLALQPFYVSFEDVFVIGVLVMAIGAGIGVVGSMIGLRRFLDA